MSTQNACASAPTRREYLCEGTSSNNNHLISKLGSIFSVFLCFVRRRRYEWGREKAKINTRFLYIFSPCCCCCSFILCVERERGAGWLCWWGRKLSGALTWACYGWLMKHKREKGGWWREKFRIFRFLVFLFLGMNFFLLIFFLLLSFHRRCRLYFCYCSLLRLLRFVVSSLRKMEKSSTLSR